jgi:hypothetical protein
MFKHLTAKIDKDADYDASTRIWNAQCRRAVLKGTIYDKQLYEFHQEKTGGLTGDYVPLRDRAPAVRYNLSRIVVLDSAALLFSEGMFPGVGHGQPEEKKKIEAIVADSNLPDVMTDAALRGSVGSIAIHMRVLGKHGADGSRVFWDVSDTDYLTPAYDPLEPDTLESITEKFKVRGSDLAKLGYAIIDTEMKADFWFQRVWDDQAEVWYFPWKVSDKDKAPDVDDERTVTHGLGFCPWVWIKNLPGGEGVDGSCTFESAIDAQIEIEYQLSQAGRGLKYSSDPTLLIKEPAMTDEKLIRSASEALVVSADGDAKLLEISGTAASAVIAYCKNLRQMALETIGGSRAEADKVTSPQSGRAQELMYQPLIWLADKLRASYGQNGLLDMMRMMVRASEKFPLRTRDEAIGKIASGPITLVWPDWFPLTANDKQALATTISTLRTAEVISRETAVTILAPIFDIEDEPAELDRIKAGMADADARAIKLKAMVTEAKTAAD